MALVLDGNGTMAVGNGDITGITRGAIESTAIGAGAVLQVVSANFSTFVATSSSSEADTGITATITPTSASSTILVIVQAEVGKYGGNAYVRTFLYRNSTSLIRFGGQQAYTGNSDSATNTIGTVYRDSPSTTSAVTYKVRWANPPGTGTIELNPSSSVATILLMEIAG